MCKVKNILRDIVVFVLVACLGLLPIAALHSCAGISSTENVARENAAQANVTSTSFSAGNVNLDSSPVDSTLGGTSAVALNAALGAHPLNNGSEDSSGLSGSEDISDSVEPNSLLESIEEDSEELSESTDPNNKKSDEIKSEKVTSLIDVTGKASLSSYYLTNDRFVTPVKLQNPWGDCWAFAITSAIESSILKAQAKLTGEYPTPDTSTSPKLTGLNGSIDLSERAIAWFAHEPQSSTATVHGNTESTSDAHSQLGEGYTRANPNDYLTQLAGGNFKIVEAMLTARQGLILEETVPYEYNGFTQSSQPWYSMDAAKKGDSRQFDWSVDESVRYVEEVGWRVSDVIRLTSPAVVDYSPYTGISQYVGYDADATQTIKQALVDVGAVAIAIEAEMNIPENVASASPDPTESSDHFDYNTWSQYNAETTVVADHAVAIVGWDDSYSASNFSGAVSGAPPGDGAWLCKNNWGSDAYYEALGHPEDALHWGIRDDSGAASGLFWLSYYDHSIINPTAFEVQPVEEDFEKLYQYDYLGSSEYLAPSTYETPVRVANVFTAESTELVQAITAQTFQPNETVTAQIYTLPPVSSESPSSEGEESASNSEGSASASSSVSSSASSEESAATENEDDGNFLADGHLIQEFSKTFDTAGFHVIELNKPVLVAKGERFAIVQNISVGKPDNDTGASESYLNMEIAFIDNSVHYKSESVPNVVSNEGETYVALFEGDDQWMTTDELNQWYADVQAEQGRIVDLVLGNALIKALTDSTSMSSSDRIYELVPLR